MTGNDASRIQIRHMGVLEEKASALCCCMFRTTATKSIGKDNDDDDVRLRVASSTACLIVCGLVVPWTVNAAADPTSGASRQTGAGATERFKLNA